ncbi:hypothetical protein K2173_013535 [Erythroxylum novogranatense]|uniref:BHLH domain-containing protein n=1 Tax=Erythroxylum novogranatense TaxID=1862640 RepID=A0AAV8TLM4_9ROSI|nr:hypothetical protein K2173_013535 [Erythroxylum novogranatense]
MVYSMNRALSPEMLRCTDMTEMERQRARLKWEQEQQVDEGCFGDFSSVFDGFQGGIGEVVTRLSSSSVKPDTVLVDNGCPGLSGFEPCGGYVSIGSGFDMNYDVCRPSSSQSAVFGAAMTDKHRGSVASEKFSSVVGRESFKKRKVDKVAAEDETREKRVKGSEEEKEESRIKDKNISKSCRENSVETSKDNSKVTEVQKPDYIHVRARRGQATDSHSLAERVRREKISERMKYLQDLVPGCNKITGKAGMLDEIINYVQSLQRQVEFLSMKLASVNPRLDLNIENLFPKEEFPSSGTSFPTIGMSSDMTNASYLEVNPVQQHMVTCGLDIGLRRTITAPVSVQETFLDSSCFTQIHPTPNWDVDQQSLYNVAFDQGRRTSLPSQQLTGSVEANNLKMEI